MKLTDYTISLPDGRRFQAQVEVTEEIREEKNRVFGPFSFGMITEKMTQPVITSIEILKLHQLVEIGDEKTLLAVQAEIEKEMME